MRLEVRKIESVTQKGKDEVTGNRIRVKIVKNKVAPPFRKAEMEIVFGKGLSASDSLLELALRHNMITKSGSWYSCGTERIGQGRENAREYLEKNPDLYHSLEAQLRQMIIDKKEGKQPKETSEITPETNL